jgi:hypothetical protein
MFLKLTLLMILLILFSLNNLKTNNNENQFILKEKKLDEDNEEEESDQEYDPQYCKNIMYVEEEEYLQDTINKNPGDYDEDSNGDSNGDSNEDSEDSEESQEELEYNEESMAESMAESNNLLNYGRYSEYQGEEFEYQMEFLQEGLLQEGLQEGLLQEGLLQDEESYNIKRFGYGKEQHNNKKILQEEHSRLNKVDYPQHKGIILPQEDEEYIRRGEITPNEELFLRKQEIMPEELMPEELMPEELMPEELMPEELMPHSRDVKYNSEYLAEINGFNKTKKNRRNPVIPDNKNFINEETNMKLNKKIILGLDPQMVEYQKLFIEHKCN